MSHIVNNLKEENVQDFDPLQEQRPNQSIGERPQHQYSSSPRRTSNAISANGIERNKSGVKGQNVKYFEIKLNFSFENDGQNSYLVIGTESDYPNMKIRANGKLSPNDGLRSNDSSESSFTSSQSSVQQNEVIVLNSNEKKNQFSGVKRSVRCGGRERDVLERTPNQSTDQKNTIEVQFPKPSQPVNRMGMSKSPNDSLSSDDSSMASVFSFSSSSIEINSPKRHIESLAEEESVSKSLNVYFDSDDSSTTSVFSFSDSSFERKQSIDSYSPEIDIKLYASEESMSRSPNVSLLSDDSSLGSLWSSGHSSDQPEETIVHYSPRNDVQLSSDEESDSKSPNVSLRSNDSSLDSLISSSNLLVQQKQIIGENRHKNYWESNLVRVSYSSSSTDSSTGSSTDSSTDSSTSSSDSAKVSCLRRVGNRIVVKVRSIYNSITTCVQRKNSKPKSSKNRKVQQKDQYMSEGIKKEMVYKMIEISGKKILKVSSKKPNCSTFE